MIVYSYSKRLLHEYMRCMPNGTDDIINEETDSMYFDKKHQAAFIANVSKIKSDYPICIGEGVNAPLGCVKQEYDVSGDSYFLGKKFYGLGKTIQMNGKHQVSYLKDGTIEVVTVDGPYEVLMDKGKHAMKIKGIPMKTKNAHGDDVQLMTKGLLESIYNGNSVKRSFSTMKKTLFGETDISQHVMSRTVRPMMEYKLWE